MHLKQRISFALVAGYSLIEVMIAMFVVAVGLMGLAGLQARALNAEIEAASRGQALALANDMAERMAANLAAVKNPLGTATYNMHSGGTNTVFDPAAHTLTVYGTGSANTSTTAAACAAKTIMAERDLCEWDIALKGISEASTSGAKIGAMSGARGCVFQQAANVYEIDVIWQGRDATGAVASDLTCGSSAITSKRRGVSKRIRVADLGA
jgi:type IV pilus assembly protein PilV